MIPKRKEKKALMFLYEVFLFVAAFIFLIPVILTFINSFKSNTEIQMNIASLPSFTMSIPKKMEQRHFEGSILNRLSENDRLFFSSFYDFKEGRYVRRYSENSKKIKSMEKNIGFSLPKELSRQNFNTQIVQNIRSDILKSKIRSELYKSFDGVYTLKKEKISPENKTKLINLLKSTGSFNTVGKNFLKNYGSSWKLTKFPTVFFNTLIITILSVVGIILISSMAAYALVRTETKLSWIVFLFFTFAMVVPFQVIMFPLVKVAKMMGCAGTIPGIVLIYMAVGCPMAIFMYHGFIKGIPIELEESASLDGAGRFKTFFSIVLPLLTPITSTIAILDVLWIWNDFLLPLIILTKKVVTIQLAQYYTRGAYSRDFGMELASLVLAVFPVIIFYMFMQRYIIKGVIAGAVKG
ncbi:MAG: carbohydrate ABC transporter permease [Spirochaetales bacterium]|nr:carbohydrate ABC transporter permease [Spirochaetales bacterium]